MYPSYPEIEVTCRTTRAGVECIASTQYGIVNLSAAVTEADEDEAKKKAKSALNKKIQQQKAYER